MEKSQDSAVTEREGMFFEAGGHWQSLWLLLELHLPACVAQSIKSENGAQWKERWTGDPVGRKKQISASPYMNTSV